MSESPADAPGVPATGEGSEATAWLAREVPGIVDGLESSGHISASTAANARRLLASGRCSQALAVALSEAGL